MSPQQPATPMQTLVVHKAQLTAENLLQLGQAGYSVLTDNDLMIFGRPAPADVAEAAAQAVPAAAPANGYAPAGSELAPG